MHGGNDGFRLFDDHAKTGGGICNTCGPYPNGILLLMAVNGWSYKNTDVMIRAALKRLPALPAHNSSAELSREQFSDYAARKLQQVLSETVPLSHPMGEPVLRYLQRRGIPRPNGLCGLRCHPNLTYCHEDGTTDQYPAMIAKVEMGDEVVSLHRTYLTQVGAKAQVAQSKKLMSPLYPGATSGAAVRLFRPPYTELAIAEGIETALAYQSLKGVAAWAALSANGMKKVVVPGYVRHVLVLGDNDRSGVGQEAAYVLAERLRSEGKHVEILIPQGLIPNGQKSLDWADVIKTAWS